MKIFIDSQAVDARPGQTVLQAAREKEIHIPALCYHPRLEPEGRCRACVVEVAGREGLSESCTLEAAEGMEVSTISEAVLAARRTVVELLLSTGHHDCRSCEKNGDCGLQEMAADLGIESPSFSFPRRLAPVDDSSPGIIRDLNRCILCGRCVAACRNNVVNQVLDYAGRGAATTIACDIDRPLGESSCVLCGECVQVCSAGALIHRSLRGKAPALDAEAVKATCPYCGVGCQIDLFVKDNELLHAAGHEDRWEEQPNKGMLCVKGRFGLDFVQSADRLQRPLLRRSRSAALEEVSWDEALDFTAGKMRRIREDHGPDALGFFASGKVTNEENYALMRFARGVVGTHNIDHCARL